MDNIEQQLHLNKCHSAYQQPSCKHSIIVHDAPARFQAQMEVLQAHVLTSSTCFYTSAANQSTLGLSRACSRHTLITTSNINNFLFIATKPSSPCRWHYPNGDVRHGQCRLQQHILRMLVAPDLRRHIRSESEIRRRSNAIDNLTNYK